MKHDSQNIPPEEFDANHVSYLLDSAELAELGGNSRLAIHLYCAAFEAAHDNGQGVDERTLSGLRQAWTLACQQGDRATAETIFNDLIPYNSDEQTQAALSELQEMAMNQMGVKKEDLEGMALAFADEMRDAGIDFDGIAQRIENAQNNSDSSMDISQLASSLFDSFAPADSTRADETSQNTQLSRVSKKESPEDQQPMLRYDNLAGYEQAKEQMRVFGIVDPADAEMQSFIEQAESFHGVNGPVLNQNFLFVGASREDAGIFAQATANEIGWPTVTMVVDVNEMGDGTIKVAAPVKRSLFGPPRITDLPNPCILVIQNIDILQDLFWNEEQAISKGYGPFGERHPDDARLSDSLRPPGMPGGVSGHTHAFQQRSFQNEILGYLSTLLTRGGVFVIATSGKSSRENPLLLSEQLESLLGKLVEIPIDLPNLSERRNLLSYFSDEHPSFHELDKESLARLSEGMSRYDLFLSCNQAVASAYSESLKKQRHQMVSLEDVLGEFIQYLPQDSQSYKLVEDYLVTLFAANLDTDLSRLKNDSNQTSLDFGDIQDEAL